MRRSNGTRTPAIRQNPGPERYVPLSQHPGQDLPQTCLLLGALDSPAWSHQHSLSQSILPPSSASQPLVVFLELLPRLLAGAAAAPGGQERLV